ncbi:hypothetical protein JMN32_12550 [Fulvivirga sp. 29W222]|uniref:Uncharacterized protein n=1 Tax=Fulvivirga marina TaxID=2494733 RepID=A0A937FZ38_9BACT|nr:hypothetical protein [Fulvivirga marina]MBL6447143.1 hypothetical protein [Fulvivirga marina]
MIRKISALGLAAIIFITSTGFQVSAHYCSGQLKSLKLFGTAKACKYERQVTKPCPMHGQMVIKSKKDCCDDENIKLDPSAYEVTAQAKVMVEHNFDFISPKYFTFEHIAFHVAHVDFATLYRPPPIDRDIPVMVQSFLL